MNFRIRSYLFHISSINRARALITNHETRMNIITFFAKIFAVFYIIPFYILLTIHVQKQQQYCQRSPTNLSLSLSSIHSYKIFDTHIHFFFSIHNILCIYIDEYNHHSLWRCCVFYRIFLLLTFVRNCSFSWFSNAIKRNSVTCCKIFCNGMKWHKNDR